MRLRSAIAALLFALFIASLAGDGLFQDEAVFALPWYGAAYHVLKTFAAAQWASDVLLAYLKRRWGVQ